MPSSSLPPSPSSASGLTTARLPGRAGRHRATAALLITALALPACQMLGETATPAPATAATGGPGTATPAPPPALPGNCGTAENASQALAKLNDYRAAGARCGTAGPFASASPLVWQPALAQLAGAHSRDMAGRARLVHEGSGGRSLTQRLDDGGYTWQGAAENVAAGQSRLALVLADWVSSPMHCANLMNPRYSEAGLACQRASDGTPYWTLILARPR